MGKASSSKKVARVARAGGRSAAARQRNLLFPGVVGGITLLGVVLVGVAANDRKSEDEVRPRLNDHWHAAVGIDVCGELQPDTPEFESETGIHTHGDGVIHIHPYTAGGAGENATLGTYLDGAGIELSDDELRVGDKSWKEGDDTCDGKDAELIVAQWRDVQGNDGKPALIRRDFDDIRFEEDGEGYTIAFVPEGTTDIPKPRSAAELAQLGAADDSTATTARGGGAPGDQSATTTVPAPSTTVPPPGAPSTTAPAG
ncbi:MAG TPA: hypothetical protein VFW63_11035 [Acidimicrobiales bacterium]|nr:hypothetical protein [Acidimicrobiales bacterium]